MKTERHRTGSAEATFALGGVLARSLVGGEILLLRGGLGAGKTLLVKGILNALNFDTDEVTSPSFALVHLYKAKFHVYHIDLWRMDGPQDAADAVGLNEILDDEDAVVIVEWAERLGDRRFERPTFDITIEGDGDDERRIEVRAP